MPLVSARAFIFVTIVSIFPNISLSADSDSYIKPYFSDPNRSQKVEATADSVAEIYKDFAERFHTPGFVYGVVLDGRLVYTGEMGFANLNDRIPASTTSLFRIASMSKSITAMAILQLRDSGYLNLDDPASKYVSALEDMTYLTSDSPSITVRHLLIHGAGFPSDDPWGDRQLAISDSQFLELLSQGPSFSTPTGSAYEYSNLGYSILGQIVQEVSGMSFEEYTTQNILVPLGMTNTVWEFDKAEFSNLALGYNWIDESFVNVPLEHHGAFGPMGGMITSIEDFAKYAAFHLSAWPPRNDPESEVLKRSSLREMQTPQQWKTFRKQSSCPFVIMYTFGLNWAEECDVDSYLSHSGGLPGFGSDWIFSPQYGLAVLAFNNRTYAAPASANRAILKHIIREAELEPIVQPVSSILNEMKGELVEILFNWDGIQNSEIFAENFFMDNRRQDVIENSQRIYAEIGDLVSVSDIDAANQLQGRFLVQGRNKDLRVSFALSPEPRPRIQSLDLTIVE